MFESIKAFGKLFSSNKRLATSTEIGAMMTSLVPNIRRLEQRLENLVERQIMTLLNIIPFDITEAKKTIRDLMYYVDDALNIDLLEYPEEEKKDWMEVIKTENKLDAFAMSDATEEFEKTRWYLMRNIKSNYKKIGSIAKEINQHFDDLEYHLDKTKTDLKIRERTYMSMITQYEKDEWGSEFNSLLDDVNDAILLGRENKQTEEYVLETKLAELKSEYKRGCSNNILKRLYRATTTQKESPIEIIVDNREELTDNDISNFFTFHYSFWSLKNHINTISLMQPLDEEDKDLFVSTVNKEYVELVMPLINRYVGIDQPYHLGILFLALEDFGLVDKKRRFAKYKRFLLGKLTNEAHLNIEDTDMISVTVGDAKDTQFCELEYGEVEGTKFSARKIKLYQDMYHRIFTILSMGGRYVPKGMKLAQYLHDPSPDISLSTIGEEQGHSLWGTLKFYHSVFKGETLLFQRM